MGDSEDPDLLVQLQQLSELKPDWNGYGEQPITFEAIARCRGIHFSPVSDGGIQIELTDGVHDVEILIGPGGLLLSAVFGHSAGWHAWNSADHPDRHPAV